MDSKRNYFAEGLAREITTKSENYTNYPTSTVAMLLESTSLRCEAIEVNLLGAFKYAQVERPVQGLPNYFGDVLKRLFISCENIDEDDIDFTSFASVYFLGLVNWTEISLKIIWEYQIQNGVQLLNEKEVERWSNG